MRAGDGGEVIVKVCAVSALTVSVHVQVGPLVMGSLTSGRDAVLSAEGRRLIMEMVDRGLTELLPAGGKP